MDLFQGDAPTPVELESSTVQSAPQYLTDYLTQLASAGTQALGTPTYDTKGKITGVTPSTSASLITPMSALQQGAYIGAGGTPTYNAQGQIIGYTGSPLTSYTGALTNAASAFARQPVTSEDITRFLNPYEQSVVDEMAKQSAINYQRNVLPSLKAGFVGQGNLGSRRYSNVLGQTAADIQSNLLAQQAKARSQGYETALEAALKEAGYDVQAGTGLSSLGRIEQEAAEEAYETLARLGSQQTAYEQSKIEAPLTRAANVAELMRGYAYPTSTESKAESFPPMYNKSPLEQITGLGSLIGAAFPAGGGGAGDKLLSAIGKVAGQIFGQSATNVGLNLPTGFSSWADYFNAAQSDTPPI